MKILHELTGTHPPVGQNAFAGHPIEVQAYVAWYSWLVTWLDDVAAGMPRADLELFQARFLGGGGRAREQQPHAVLALFADTLHEAPAHYDRIAANFIVTSSLAFVNACALELRPGFDSAGLRARTEGGDNWPYYLREKTGIAEAYAYLVFPKSLCPDNFEFMACCLDFLPPSRLSCWPKLRWTS